VIGLVGGALAWFAATASAATTMPTGTQTVNLQFVVDPQPPNSWYGYSIGQDGKVQLPFSSASGTLLLQLKDDKLQADTNGDGVIDGKDAAAVKPENVTILVPTKVDGKVVNYPFLIRGVEGNGQTNRLLVFSPRGMLEGRLGSYTVRIKDRGRFGRFGEGDSLVLTDSSQPTSGASTAEFPGSKTTELDGSLYQIAMVGEGAQLIVTPYTGEIAEVTLRPAGEHVVASATLVAQDRSQVSELGANQTKRMVPTRYQVNCTLQTTGTDASYLSSQPSGRAKPFDAKPGRNVLKVGAPFTLEFTAARKGDQIDLIDAALLGCSKESYRPSLQPQNKDVFAAYIRAGEKETKLADLGFS
jgi:hypothetical protein